jgi:hypothetical protein
MEEIHGLLFFTLNRERFTRWEELTQCALERRLVEPFSMQVVADKKY